MAELRAATGPAHQRLEKSLDVKRRFTRLTDYRAHLARMWGFCSGVEQRIEPHTLRAALPDYETRRKLPLLNRDLIALGIAPGAIARLPRCEHLPDFSDPAAALGCVYVLEGATLGGRTLLTLVAQRLDLSAEHGASFLASYGAQLEAKWLDFQTAVEAGCRSPVQRALATQSAVATFTALHAWLCAPSPAVADTPTV